MGKKNKDKKGKGKEKTEQKTERNASKRAKKELAKTGEEDIEQMIAEFVAKDKRLTQVIEEKSAPPSPRTNMTLLPHPDKEELIMFGGEYFTGKQMYLYNDLFFYNIRKNEWLKVTSPNAPPPRSAHQAVTLAQSGGQMWVFGGEFSSHSQNQFYHYRDLWLLHLKEKRWEQFKSSGKTGPTARSGHRMVSFRNQLILFGGFHDNNRDYKYHNDLWAFDLGTYEWSQLTPGGSAPSPRSGCVLFPTLTGSRLLVYGGYSMEKVRRDVDQGTIHTDMFALQPEGKGADGKPAKWRWQPVKQSGSKPTPRCSMSAVVAPGNHGVMFGGVQDEEEDEEQLDGTFFNDMFTLDLDKGHWFPVQLRGSRPPAGERKRRRKAKEEGGEGEGDENNEDGDEEMEEDDVETAEDDLESLALGGSAPASDGAALSADLTAPPHQSETASSQSETAPSHQSETASSQSGTDSLVPEAEAAAPSTSSEGGGGGGGGDVFTVTIGPQSGDAASSSGPSGACGPREPVFVPCPRMKPCLAVKNGILYLYGGTFEEENDRQVTLNDLYALDLAKLDVWKTIIASDLKLQAWQDSDSEEEGAGAASSSDDKRKHKPARRREEEEEESDDDDDDDDDDDEDDMTFDDAPPRNADESGEDYFQRTQDYWLLQAKNIMEEEDIKLSHRKLLKFAKEICQEAATTATSSSAKAEAME